MTRAPDSMRVGGGGGRRASRRIDLLLAVALTLMLSAATSHADEQALPDPVAVSRGGGLDQPLDSPGGDAADLDKILSMDVEQLSNASVNATISTFSDPVVEGVSRSSEKSSKAPGVVQVITAEQIRAYGGKTLREVLERATSIWTPNSAYVPNNVTSIRGDLFGHYDIHVLLLMNNRPFKDTNQGGMHMAIYNSFPIEMLERIEIIRGPGSVLYGTNAYSGVINLVTKKGAVSANEASVLAGSNDTYRYGATLGSGDQDADSDLYIGAMHLRSGGFEFSGFDEIGAPFSHLFHHDDYGVGAALQYGDFTFNSLIAQSIQGGLGTPTGRALDNAYFAATRAFADVGYTLGAGEDVSLETHFTYNYSDQSSFTPTLAIGSFISHDYLFEPILRASITDKLQWMGGATAEIREGQLGTAVPKYSKTWYSAYTQVVYQANEWLTLTAGVQGNMPGTLKHGVAPRAGAILQLTELWSTKLLYGNAFRSPSSSETDFSAGTVFVGNPNLAPETIDTYEAQLVRTTEGSRLACTYFHSIYSDMVARDGSLSPPTYGNLGSLEIQGVELESAVKCTESLRFVSGVTWQQNIDDAGVADTTHAPNWMAKLGVAYDNGLVAMGLFDSYFSAPGSVTVVNPGALIVNPIPTEYHSLSLNTRLDMGRLFGGRADVVEWQLLVQNLLDEDIYHPEFSRRRINSLRAYGGRTFYSGITINY
ncbi:Colicin I receptor precursor [Posidoniimonas polymericola]|uniref:Colicin I receptor n=1 Tax=Posidoniimonas polymericola TaxID=2528002 RepID=A0A5C5YU56_9BACT|nr:TonB-dependent receptor [Posidoniimonas polymericola]TWT78508.1 Colicin I receptor precursor [Posidoniimonas polymericola]